MQPAIFGNDSPSAEHGLVVKAGLGALTLMYQAMVERPPNIELARAAYRLSAPLGEAPGEIDVRQLEFANLRACGLALPFAEVAIWDERNQPLPANVVGEIVARADDMIISGGVTVTTEPLPKSPVGKIKRKELREPFWAGQERRVSGS